MSAMSEIDFFISSTCIFNIFTRLHMKILLNFPVGGYIGHSDTEIAFPGSEGSKGKKVVNVKFQKTLSSSSSATVLSCWPRTYESDVHLFPKGSR